MKLFLVLSFFAVTFFAPCCLPPPPAYPAYSSFDSVNSEAQKLSDSLEWYIKQWYYGKATASIPERYLPKGYDTGRYHHFKLLRRNEITQKDVWVIRTAHKIDFNRLYGSFPDPNCTYLVMPLMYAPFQSKLYIVGEFPYCRFFNIQVSPPFDAHEYRYDKWAGKGEVGIIDTDIEPEPGSVNPFLPNGDRMNKNRKYKVCFKMAIGNAADIDSSHRPPYYRAKSNKRYASAIQPQGPWGLSKKDGGHGRGFWDFGDVWMRYYAIDHAAGPMGGVKVPEAYFELKTGEQFFITANFDGLIKASETTMPNRKIGNSDPADYNGPNVGWEKAYGIFLSIASGLTKAVFQTKTKDKDYIRKLDLGVTGRGEDQPAPASYEPHATGCNYTGYLQSGVSVKKGKVFVLTGKLPTFPDTRKGAKIFQTAQCRYWSVTTYDADFPFSKIKGLENSSIMDDEIVLDKDRKYIIVYSRPEDRPANATKENGVTWVNWGQTCIQAMTLRWMSVGPEWAFEKTPNEINLPWKHCTFTATQYKPDEYIGSNHNKGFLKEYHPVRHYMTKKDFESLGTKLHSDHIPDWRIYQ
jgi:hypothetical protein